MIGGLGTLTGGYQIKMPAKSGPIKDLNREFEEIIPGEPKEIVECRSQEFHNTLEFIENAISQIITEIHADSLSEITAFLCADPEEFPITLLQTAIILGGLALSNIVGYDGSDQNMFYNQLAEQAKGNFKLASLTSSDSTVKECIKRMIEQFIFDDSDELVSGISVYDFQSLVDWYKAKKRPKLIVVIQSYEEFNINTLQKLIQIFTGRQSEIPITLQIGIATGVDTLNQTLNTYTLKCLNTKVFHLQRSTQIVNKIVEKVFLGNSDMLKLGNLPYRTLIDKFDNCNLSADGFIKGIRYCVMAFFYGNPVSVFLSKDLDFDYVQPKHYHSLRTLPSFKKYVQENADSDFTLNNEGSNHFESLLDDNSYLFDWTKAQINRIFTYAKNYSAALMIFAHLQRHFTSACSLRSLYEDGLVMSLGDCTRMKASLQLLRKMKLVKIVQFMREAVDLLSNYPDVQNEFIEIIENVDIDEDETSEDEENEDLILKENKKRIRQELLCGRKTKVSSKSGASDPTFSLFEGNDYEKQISKIIEFLAKYFRTSLVHYKTLPMHELVFFGDNSKLVSKSFKAEPRAVVQTALNSPWTYLNCKCCEEGSMSKELPDTSIIYKIYLDCGRLINLQDWFEAFVSILDPRNSEKYNAVHLQARFMKSIAELQFLGFIRHTSRKTDHVTRLTW